MVVPGTIPVTTPPVPMTATEVLVLDHEPPVVLLDSVILKPGHTAGGPEIAAGNAVTVATLVA